MKNRPENSGIAGGAGFPEIPGVAWVEAGPGGLPVYEIRTPLAEARVFLHGAHVAHFAPVGEEAVLMMSGQSSFAAGKAIRGGVPVIFPWFGPREGRPDSPAHGFARTRAWAVESLVERPGGAVELSLVLSADEESTRLWGIGADNAQSNTPGIPTHPGDWLLRHRVTIARELTMELEIENRGARAFRCEEALHTYFRVGDVRMAEALGLAEARYYDKADGMRPKRQAGAAIRFDRETDRTYVDTEADCVIVDPVLRRRIFVEKTGSRSTIVWNPWVAKAAAMADFGDNEWPQMLCVETGNVADNALEIPPSGRHATRTRLRVERMA